MTKQIILCIFLLFFSAECWTKNRVVAGRVEDENAQPVPYANIYSGMTGTMSDESGFFRFTLSVAGDSIRLNASAIGYNPYRRTFASLSDSLWTVIVLKSQTLDMQEVVVKGVMQRMKGNGAWNNISPIAIATTGGSAGDLYRSLQVLPGVQPQSESGKLVVRGGDSRETQTYIDDMHVLTPYTSNGENAPVRGRYSPFMFEGINFSSGGYSQEYGDGLSAVLPLYTKDKSKLTKWGVNPSTVGLSGGGTGAFDKGSVSLNLEYQNMKPYFSIIPNRLNMTEPYTAGSAAAQMRFTPNDRTVFKSYISYDNTHFRQGVMDFDENNIYVNTTFRYTAENGYRLFAGMAFSDRVQHMAGVRHENDRFDDKARELHLKVKGEKQFTGFLRLSAGMESYTRRFSNEYTDSMINSSMSVNPDLISAFAIATLYPSRNLNVDISSRLENKTLLARVSANYNLYDINFSAAAGQYVQQADVKYLFDNPEITYGHCLQYVAGARYAHRGRTYRAEFYLKDYSHLPLVSEDGTVTSGGYGYSRGFDLFFSDEAPVKNFGYQATYTFNLSKRKSDSYKEMTVPYFAPRHNVSLVLKYMAQPLKTIVGVTGQYASGRPLSEGFTKPYSSLDLSLTYLPHPKLIVYGSVSNLLGRQNMFSNAAGNPVKPACDRFIYVGVFISLGGKSAYDASNF